MIVLKDNRWLKVSLPVIAEKLLTSQKDHFIETGTSRFSH
jgi:hypothetical protein